ncbi:MAG: leucine-rich repeat protein [Clostridia bacterium]|nr:leucine-rich repeat protein [Clostridia bacterium]
MKNTLKKLLALCAVIAVLLTVLALPASAKSAAGFRYYLTEAWYDDEEMYAVVTGCSADVNGKLTIPEKLNGHKVFMIAAAAFSDRKDITSVVIPDTVDFVEEFAFENCKNLRTLTIGAAYVERGAFSGCTSLRTVHITAYGYEYMTCEGNWSDSDNDPLFNAEVDWVHYNKPCDTDSKTISAVTGQKKTLTCTYAGVKKTDAYHWYWGEGYCMTSDMDLEDCDSASVTLRASYPDDGIIVCEVVDANGDVVCIQSFFIHVRASLGFRMRSAAEQSWLYGVTNYTLNHIRWQYVNPALDALGIEY